MTTPTETRLMICVSTGAEIDKPGDYCLYLATAAVEDGETVEIDGAAGILTPISSDPADLDLDDAIVKVSADYRDEIPEGVEWVVNRAGVPDHNGYVTHDMYGGYTVAEVTFANRGATGNLYDAATATYIGPATPEQMAASDRSDEKGENGIFLVSVDGTPIEAGSWDAQQDGVRVVYAL